MCFLVYNLLVAYWTVKPHILWVCLYYKLLLRNFQCQQHVEFFLLLKYWFVGELYVFERRLEKHTKKMILICCKMMFSTKLLLLSPVNMLLNHISSVRYLKISAWIMWPLDEKGGPWTARTLETLHICLKTCACSITRLHQRLGCCRFLSSPIIDRDVSGAAHFLPHCWSNLSCSTGKILLRRR